MEKSQENKEKIRRWMIEMGYEFVTEKEDPRTNFVLEAKKKEEDKNVSFRIISPKSSDLIIVSSTSKLTGSDAHSFIALEKKIVMSIEYNMKRNALLANLDFFMTITADQVQTHISDDMYDDGLSKDRIYDIIKRISAFYEFMNYVFRDHGMGRPVKEDDDLL
jgi:hypothetical protein